MKSPLAVWHTTLSAIKGFIAGSTKVFIHRIPSLGEGSTKTKAAKTREAQVAQTSVSSVPQSKTRANCLYATIMFERDFGREFLDGRKATWRRVHAAANHRIKAKSLENPIRTSSSAWGSGILECQYSTFLAFRFAKWDGRDIEPFEPPPPMANYLPTPVGRLMRQPVLFAPGSACAICCSYRIDYPSGNQWNCVPISRFWSPPIVHDFTRPCLRVGRN